MRDGADERRFVLLHLGHGFGDAVLADDGHMFFALVFADGVNGAEGAGVGGRRDEDVLVLGVAIEEVGDELPALIAKASAIHADEELYGQLGAAFAYSLERAGDSALHKLAGFRKVKADDPVYFAGPIVDGIR